MSDATNYAIAAASAGEDGEVAVLLKGPRDKTARREELLHGKTTEETAFSLFYNSKSNKGMQFEPRRKRSLIITCLFVCGIEDL